MRKEIELDDIVFPTTQAAKDYFSAMLSRHKVGELITNDIEHRDLEALIKLHPDAKEKVGIGIKCFSVEIHPGHASRCFCIHRRDHSTEYFSYRKALKGSPDTLAAKFNAAARRAIAPELQMAKHHLIEQNGGRGFCEVTNKELPPEALTVDHMRPYGFSVIADLFLRQTGLTLDDNLFKTSTADQLEFSDRELAERFCNHHRVVSKGFLRLVAKTPNITDAARHKLTRAKVPLVLSSDNR